MTIAALMRQVGAERKPPTLEEVLCDPVWFGLTTASPLQRAVCRWAEGLPVDHERLAADLRGLSEGYAPDIAERMQLDWILGGKARPTRRPRHVCLVAAIRTAKSQLDAAAATWSALTVPVPDYIKPGEILRHSTVSVDLDKAKGVLQHFNGWEDRPGLAGVIERDVAEGVDIRTPTGHTAQVRVVHGGRAGKGLVAFWHLGATFDESTRMLGEDEAKVNLDEAAGAVVNRILDGGQMWWTGSPYAPMGPVYDLVQEHHGTPGDVLVIRAPGPALNPYHWTPERCEEARGTESFRTDVLGEWGTPESMMFSHEELGAVLRQGELPPQPGETYVACMDPAGRGGNAWTLVIGGKAPGGIPRLALARQWFPRAGFTEGDVLKAIRPLLERYGVRFVYTDQYASGFVQDLGREVGIVMAEFKARPWTSANKLDAYDSLRTMVREKRVELIDAPNLREDLLRVRRKLTQNGATILTPETGDGRHCDYASAIAMWAVVPMMQAEPQLTDEQRLAAELEREEMEEATPDPPHRRRAPRVGRLMRGRR